METKLNQEPEIEKPNEAMPEGTPLQNVLSPTAEPQIDPLKKLQDELAEAKDKYVRLYAEFDNHRRRSAKEKLEMIQLANEQLIKSLLHVVDDFERAEKVFKEKNDKESEGLLLIHNKLKKVLEQYHVKVMIVEKDSDFDTDLHEAITQVTAREEKLKGKIIDVVEKGYLVGEKVIRFAKVVVGN